MSTDAHDHIKPPAHRRLRRLMVLVAIAAAAVALAACGSSARTTSSSTNSASTGQGAKSGAGRFASLRTCLQKQGINLPAPKGAPGGQPPGGQAPGGQAPGGQPPGGNGGRPGGGILKAPEGVSQAKFQEALKKCGAGNFPRGGSAPNSATARTALTNYASCMRENGVNLPAPNTSGKGPVFNTSGINTSSAAFKAAQKQCQSKLAGAFGGNGGSPGGQPPA